MALCSCFLKPFSCFFLIFLYPTSFEVTYTKIILRIGISQICCFLKPFYGLHFVQ